MKTRHQSYVLSGVAACLLTLPCPGIAQTDPAELLPDTLVCKQDPRFSEWSFWHGHWRVLAGPEKDKLAGTNTITPIEDGCAFMENWQGQGGSSGQSLNYFNPVTGKWRQLWVAQPGYMIDIEGGPSAGTMVLEGEIFYYARGLRFPFRGTWTPNPDGSVRQYFQQYDPEQQAWTDWFDGRYVPLAE